MNEQFEIRIHGYAEPTIIYLPGTHGDWTLNTAFSHAIERHARLVELTFPRTLNLSLADYADAIEHKLIENKIQSGWVLAESFSSQIAWTWVGQNSKNFQIEGIILAGGFVRHPIIPAVQFAKFLTTNIPLSVLKLVLRFYIFYARMRQGNSPETRASLTEFTKRRTREDLLAATHRLRLIATHDLRAIARRTEIPVYYLTGFLDPVVPWPFVWLWLTRNCPGFRDWKLIYSSDHHVLGAGNISAEQIADWIHTV